MGGRKGSAELLCQAGRETLRRDAGDSRQYLREENRMGWNCVAFPLGVWYDRHVI